jgi:hypothetical protein
MGCRCSDINRCQNELGSLSGIVSSNLNNVSSSNLQISQALYMAAGSLGDAVNTSNIYEVSTQLNTANRGGEDLSQKLCTDCNSEIQRLTVLLSQLRAEDRSYHQAQAAAARNSI